MFTQESLSHHPKLSAFLNADNEAQRIQLLSLLEERYPLTDAQGALTSASLIQILAALGKLDHLNLLIGSENFRDTQLVAENNRALWLAAQQGQLAVVNRLLAFDIVKNKVDAYNNRALAFAAGEGHLAVANCLLEFDAVRKQIAIDDNGALCLAVRDGHLAMVNRLLEFNLVNTQVAIKGNKALRYAASNGHLAVLNRLLSFDAVKNEIAADDNWCFRWAAGSGHLEVMNRLLEFNAVRNHITIRNNGAFLFAAEYGRLAVVNRLLEFDVVKNDVTAQHNRALREAASNGHLAVVDRLLEFDAVKNQVDVQNNIIFIKTAARGQVAVVKRLLSFSKVFAYAEMHEQEYSQYTHSYLDEKLGLLHGERHLQETMHPEILFDIADVEEAKLFFYIARNLIRRNDSALLDELRFLLEIPALKHLASAEVTPGLSNELIRLALIIGNQGAAEILLNIPAVHELAIANDYYQYEQEGRLNLRQLAQDQESSMHALTISEQERLSSAIQHYQALMNQAGSEHLFQALKAQLKDRYETNPATIRVDGKILNLPISFEAFQQLKLPKPLYSEALKAYYQNKDHTALRYLSKPNPWMHPEASYVYVNPYHRIERWSTFEEYSALILMFWLAAIDESMVPTENQTLEGRLDHFIDELALIGRAHNWDQSRIRVNSSIDCGTRQQEEYDDLEGDKPSCFSGVKRRLFQSVFGHPLLQMLTLDIVKQELQDFVRNHFTILIMKDKQGALKEAYETYLIELEVTPTLRQFDLSADAQNDFLSYLQKKYGQQFDRDTSFTKYIHTRFELKKNQKGEVDDAHILNFAAEANIEQLLLSQNSQLLGNFESKNTDKLEQLGFFSQSRSEQESSPIKDQKLMTLK